MANHLAYDNFSDIFAFKAAITSRPDNGKVDNHSRTNSNEFSGMSLDDAFRCVTDGLPEKADALKREINKFKADITGTLTQRRPINYYNGHAPNVPAAIIGLPKSMRKVTRTPSKVKTITLFYNNTANAMVDADDLDRAGACVLQLVYWLELNGYRIKLALVPYLAESRNNDFAVCNILLKDFKQPLDLLKLSFSVNSVSMFRRLGFRWLETVPTLKDNAWKNGYGRQVQNKSKALDLLKRSGQNTENAYFIRYSDCANADFNPVELAHNLGIKAGN